MTGSFCCLWKLLCNWLALIPIIPIAVSSLRSPSYEIESRDERAANGKKYVYTAANPPAAFCVFVQLEKVFHVEGRYLVANGRAPVKKGNQ